MADATDNVAEKRQALDDLMRKSVVDIKAVEAAQRSLTDAERGLVSAQERQVAAVERLETLRRGPTADTVAEAELSLREAALRGGLDDAECVPNVSRRRSTDVD